MAVATIVQQALTVASLDDIPRSSANPGVDRAWACARRCSPTAPARSAAVAAILLLYAQPFNRITIDDIIRDGDQILLRLGDPPSPMSRPVAALLLESLGLRTNMRTPEPQLTLAVARTTRRRAAAVRHTLKPDSSPRFPSIAARAGAIRQHVLDMPAPIVAAALGYRQVVTARLAIEFGITWSHYALVDHRW
ncbi:hypothetical protein ACPCHT_32250 [Nucisporomicrobium flavum]|uniref:hypothetical protein n=1 Tax=Nucisporomicrobium flavum TaxID=2785915 RepID=UPI003C2CF8A4